MSEPIRINKYIAEQGWASRREADTLIADGKILVNGKPAEIGQKITEADSVELIGNTKEKIYLAYYKGRGIITHSPAAGETDIMTQLKSRIEGSNPSIADVHPVGRLDKDSEGLMILSNDGRITRPLLDTDHHVEKTYEVEVDKDVNNFLLKHVQKGVDIEGYKTKPAKAKEKSPKRFLLTLTEGKKHQIRRMCAALGFQVQSLKRVQVANITLGALKPNQYRKITGYELKQFLQLLGVQ